MIVHYCKLFLQFKSAVWHISEFWITGRFKFAVCQFKICVYRTVFISVACLPLKTFVSCCSLSRNNMHYLTLQMEFYCNISKFYSTKNMPSVHTDSSFSSLKTFYSFLLEIEVDAVWFWCSWWFHTMFAHCNFQQNTLYFLLLHLWSKVKPVSPALAVCQYLKDRGKPLGLSVTVTW